MARVLVSQIGKPKTKDGEYELTSYRLENRVFRTAMMSYGLVEQLNPDKVIFLGTSGSAWTGLLRMALDTDEHIEKHLERFDAIQEDLEAKEKSDTVSAHDLSPISELLTKRFNKPVKCLLTPYLDSNTAYDTTQYLRTLAGAVEVQDRLLLDVTHGLRYHPMLSLLVAQYLKSVMQIQIEGIYYGAFDRNIDGIAPVLRLDGMLQVLDWITALSSFDKDADYSVFSPLMHQDNVPAEVCTALTQAAFFERISATVKASESLTPFKQFKPDPEQNPLAELFDNTLKDRIQWSSKNSRGEKEFQLSEDYLKRNDYIRAAIYAQEGFISSGLEQAMRHRELNDYDARDSFSKDNSIEAFRALKKIRNALAHGLRSSDQKVMSIFKKSETLKSELTKLIKALRSH